MFSTSAATSRCTVAARSTATPLRHRQYATHSCCTCVSCFDLFYGPTREDGVGVGHFRRTLPEFGAKFPKIKAPKPRDVEEVRVNLHNRLAHLTASRWEKRSPDMAYYS